MIGDFTRENKYNERLKRNNRLIMDKAGYFVAGMLFALAIVMVLIQIGKVDFNEKIADYQYEPSVIRFYVK